MYRRNIGKRLRGMPAVARFLSSDTGRAGLSRGVNLKGRKRFWQTTDVEPVVNTDGPTTYDVVVDGRTVKTPYRHPLRLPSKPLAMAIALEWDSQCDHKGIQPETMPLTTLAATAIDNSRNTAVMVDGLLRYLETDTTCYYAFEEHEDRELVKRQKKHWDHLREWIKADFGAPLFTTAGILSKPQPEESIAVIRQIVEQLDCWRLTVLNCVVREAKSMVIGLALIHGKVNANQAIAAARVEEEFNVEKWGLVEGGHDLDRAHANVQVYSAATFLHLLSMKNTKSS